MPVYEYACGTCGHRFEEWQKISDEPVRTCPKCGGNEVERLISLTSFQLKGSGWYKDLYSSGAGSGSGKKAEAASDSGGSEKSDKSDKAAKQEKADSKPAGGGKPPAASAAA